MNKYQKIKVETVETSETFEMFKANNPLSGKWDADGSYKGLIQKPNEIKWSWFQFIPGADGRNTVKVGPHAKYKGCEEVEGRQVCKPSNRPW